MAEFNEEHDAWLTLAAGEPGFVSYSIDEDKDAWLEFVPKEELGGVQIIGENDKAFKQGNKRQFRELRRFVEMRISTN